MEEYGQWDSTLTFIFAMIGVAIGLGNIWRFSYIVYSNGGGAFFIPYFFAIAIMGIPFLILEYGIGFSFKRSFTEIFKSINPKFEYIAWILIFSITIVLIYYMVIIQLGHVLSCKKLYIRLGKRYRSILYSKCWRQ